jgi:hypothetical protein
MKLNEKEIQTLKVQFLEEFMSDRLTTNFNNELCVDKIMDYWLAVIDTILEERVKEIRREIESMDNSFVFVSLDRTEIIYGVLNLPSLSK